MTKAFIVRSVVMLVLLLLFFFLSSALDAHRRFAWIPYPLARAATDANGPLAITGLRGCFVGPSVDVVRAVVWVDEEVDEEDLDGAD